MTRNFLRLYVRTSSGSQAFSDHRPCQTTGLLSCLLTHTSGAKAGSSLWLMGLANAWPGLTPLDLHHQRVRVVSFVLHPGAKVARLPGLAEDQLRSLPPAHHLAASVCELHQAGVRRGAGARPRDAVARECVPPDDALLALTIHRGSAALAGLRPLWRCLAPCYA